MLQTDKITSRLPSTAAGTSTKSFIFFSGRITLLMPQRCAANICEREQSKKQHLWYMHTTHEQSWAPTLIKFMAKRWCFPKLMIRVHFFNKWYSVFINQVSHNHHIDHKNIYAKLQSIKLDMHIWNNEHEILATSPKSYITCHKLHFTARFDSRKKCYWIC